MPNKTMNNNEHEGMSAKTMIAIGAGVAALATASYYLFGPDGEENREKMKGWMIKMKGEIVDKIEDVKELTEPIYHGIVDSVVATYATTTKVGKEELAAYAEKLKGQWKEIVASTQEKAAKKTKKAVRRIAKKTGAK